MNEEKVLFRGSSSPVVSIGTFLICGVIMIGSVVAALMLDNHWFFALTGLAFIYMLGRWLIIKTRIYELTTERLRIRTGVFTHRTDEMELYRIQDVTLIEPFLYRIFGAGNILMTTMDTSTPSVTLQAIPGARQLREELRQSVELYRDRKRVRVTEME